MTVKNPYSDLLVMMRQQGAKFNPPSIQLGKVISPAPNLTILAGDLQLKAEDMLVASGLPDSLVNGDMVAMLPVENGQTFIVLCKVVGL